MINMLINDHIDIHFYRILIIEVSILDRSYKTSDVSHVLLSTCVLFADQTCSQPAWIINCICLIFPAQSKITKTELLTKMMELKEYSAQLWTNTHRNDQEILIKMMKNTHNMLKKYSATYQEILTTIIKKYSPQWWGFQQDCHEHLGSRRDVVALSEKYWDWRLAKDWNNTSLPYWI